MGWMNNIKTAGVWVTGLLAIVSVSAPLHDAEFFTIETEVPSMEQYPDTME